MAIETELKFTVTDPAVFDRIAAFEKIAGYAVEDRSIIVIHDTAFDTPERALFHGTSVLRLREKGGARFLTFKAHKASDGGYYQRIEHEEPTTATVDDISFGRLPDIEPVHAFRETFGDIRVAPCLSTANDRHILLLVSDGDPQYELALDSVTFTGPRGIAHVHELEVEALTDDYRDIERIGAWLSGRFDLAPAGPSKFTLGMELVGDVDAENRAPEG